ncbi:hypothetical protein [Flavobacterium defluvii]|uniref:Uncharacterized protein n=1 Tax=Flavobacterium defluvii TaxID=370979 RepID=A0A1M5I566_9FLAO|nr:hypothetical protein [Flavobacterium defluvii]SHG23259.1 hypothetical protein SAMN05443663_102263 [Flavobacterium defluvii]
MYGISPFILIILPLLFQLVYGRKSIGESISLKFGTVSLISFILQVVLSIAACYIASYNFTESLEGRPYRCGMGILGIIVLVFLLTIILLIVIIVQYFIKRSYEK